MSYLVGYNPATTSTAFSSGIYRHVAMTISGSTHTLYLDGAVVATNTNAGNVFSTYSSLSNLYLGSAADLSFGFTGFIDDFKIWNRVLPSTDIISVYTNNNPNLGPIDNLSSTTKSALLNAGTILSAGAYGVRLLYSKYIYPVITIRRSADSVTANFYADISSNLGTEFNGSGTSLTSWLNGSIAYVTQWWDQTGNTNHATQSTTDNQPIYDTTNKLITFPTNAFFNLPNGAHPYNDSEYSYVFKCSIINNTGGVFGGGNMGTSYQINTFRRNTTNYMEAWWGYDLTSTNNSYADNSIISTTYNKITGYKYIYQNGSLIGSLAASNRQQTNVNNYIGKSGYNVNEQCMNGGYIAYMYIVPTSISDADRAFLEATPATNVVILTGVTIPPVTYILTDGSTTVTSMPIQWTFVSGSQSNPSVAITVYSATISNSPYSILNGTYYTTSSSALNSTAYSTSTDTTTSGPHEYGFSCFDGCYAGATTGTYAANYYSWISKTTSYSQTSPYTYTGGTFSTTVSGTSYGGEYVQLQLPNAVSIKGFKIYYPEKNVCGLMSAVLAGSNDGSTWNFIYKLDNGTTRPTQRTNATFSFTNNTTAYNYYRFICTGVLYSASTALIGINELIFNT